MEKIELNENVYGHFVKLPRSSCDNGMTLFGVVVGYDFVDNVYIAKNLGSYLNGYVKIVNSSEKLNIYSLKDVLLSIEDGISKENKNKSVLGFSFCERMGRELRANELNETKRLFCAYREIIKQIEIYEEYIRYAERGERLDEIALYTHHLSKTRRALRRIDKRFFYYFGENGRNIQEVLRLYSCFSDIKYADNRIDENIRKYNFMRENVKKIAKMKGEVAIR